MDQFVILEENGFTCYKFKRDDGNYGEGYTYIRDCTHEENVARDHSMRRVFYPGGGGYFMWRPGVFYKIRELAKMDIHGWKKNDTVALADYKEKYDEKYVAIDDPIRLQPLFNFHSRCINGTGKDYFKTSPEKLIGKEIHILSVEQLPYNNSITYKVIWRLIGDSVIQSVRTRLRERYSDPYEIVLLDELGFPMS
jgi:hypothetical protein